MARTTGFGCIIKRGKWYSLEYYLNGKKIVKSLHTQDLKEAKAEQQRRMGIIHSTNTTEDIVHQIEKAKNLENHKAIKLAKVWEEYEKSFKRSLSSEGTLNNHKRNWEKLKIWLNKNHPEITQLHQISKTEAVEYANFLWTVGSITGETFKQKIASCKMVYKVLMEDTKTPFDEIKKETEHGIGREAFTEEQIKTIHATIKNPDFYVREKEEYITVCLLGQYLGLRFVDAILFKPKSILFDKNNVHLMPVKTKRTKRFITVPIHPELLKRFKSLDLTGEYLCPVLAKRYLNESTRPNVSVDFLHILKAAKIVEIESRTRGKARNKYGYYSFRHYFGSKMANNDVTLAVLADMMGDDIQTASKYYVKINDESKNKAINSLSSVKSASEAEVLTNRIQKACKAIESAKISKAIKAKLLKILQG